jgi:hypothetical protein
MAKEKLLISLNKDIADRTKLEAKVNHTSVSWVVEDTLRGMFKVKDDLKNRPENSIKELQSYIAELRNIVKLKEEGSIKK